MADENIVTNIVAKSDFSNLISDLNKVSFSLTKLQDQLIATNKTLAAQVSVMNRSFADTLRSTGQYSTHFVSLTSDVDKFGSQLDKGQLKLSKFFQVYGQHAKTSGGLIRDLAKQQVQLQQAILQPLGKNAEGLMQYNVHIPRGLDLVKNKAAIAKQELMIMNKVVQEGANQLINWGKNTQWAGRQLTVGLTVPLAAFGKASADAFRQADEQLVRLTKVYGGLAQTSSKDLGKVRDDVAKTAADLAKSYGAAFKDTLGLAADIAATGKQGNDLLGSIRETTRLSVLGEVDRQDAMKATLAIQSAFKQNTDELSESINFLNAVENQTSTTLNDLVEAIPKAGPIIKGLGGSVQDLALYLTAMREGGINATEGANALKSGLASLINPTNVAVAKFKTFGIDLLGIVNNNAGNVTGTLLELQSALDKLNPLQKQQAIEQLFGKFQFSRLNALFENLGKQGSQTLQVLDLMKASSQELGALADRELAQVTESASGKYRRAVEGLRADLAGIGEQFLKINTSLINFVDGIIKFVQKLPDPIKQALGFMGMLTAAAGPLIMLTGVLGNFFGYIIKGAYHFKSLFKGGEGWKLLTPEILAAQKAGNLVEQTFYSDAKAAAVLKQAIAGLTAEFTLLQQRAASAAMTVNPGISTVAGSTILAGRVVNPMSPYVGKEGTRAAGHHIPRSQMTEAERLAQTVHSFTPVPIPLNQKIGAAPQIFTEGDLPKIPGLTTSGGVSTGIVAGEAAKWHALMGTLSMMTKREVSDLKKEIARTGTFSTEINSTFGQLLPAMTKLTSNAAAESALIVQELQAGKITVEAARAKIIAINAQLEAMMAQTTTQVAADLGRTANLTQVPLINQPIVSPTGKANIKEIFRPNRPSAKIIDKIARALGVRTWGGGYSTETTMPKRMNMGGYVYTMNDGSMVPGPNVNADVVPAMLTPGEFVVNREAAQANLPLLMQINNNRQSSSNSMAVGGIAGGLRSLSSLVGGVRRVARPGVRPSVRLGYEPGALNYEQMALRAGRNAVWNDPLLALGRPNENEVVGHLFTNDFYKRIGPRAGAASSPQLTSADLLSKTGIQLRSKSGYSGLHDILPNNYMVISKDFNKALNKGNATAQQWLSSNRGPQHLTSLLHYLSSQGVPANTALTIASAALNKINLKVSRISGPISEAMFGNIVTNTSAEVVKSSPLLSQFNTASRGIHPNTYSIHSRGRSTSLNMPLNRMGNTWSNPRYIGGQVNDRSYVRVNRGGMIRMNRGGMVPGYQNGGPVSAFTSGLRNPYGRSLLSGGMPQIGTGASIGIGMGGMLAGQMIGGPAGNAVMLASSLASMMPLFGGLSKGIGIVTKLASVLGRLTIPGALIGSLAFVGKLLLDAKEKAEDLGKANRLAFGGTQESFASVGITKFKTLSDRLKEVNEQIELNKAKAQSAYEAYTKGGPTGITLSIAELNEAIENAKKNQTEYIKAFNNIDSGGVSKYAADLKAQFVAMGLSASEASNQIFAMIKASEKAGQALSAVTSTDFRNIIDQTTALTKLFENLGKASTVSNFNPEEFSAGLDTLINSVIAYQEGLIGTKDALDPKNIIDSAEALRITMEKIGKINGANSKLSTDQINKLKEQNTIYASILNNLESTASITAKILLYNNQLASVIDLSAMSGVDAINMTKDLSLVQEGLNQITEDTSKGNKNPLEFLAKPISLASQATKNYAKSIESAQKQDKEYYSNKIKAIDLEIKKIREAADARRKALQEQQDAESYTNEIKKLQLEYQNALASGDMSRAAQAQLNIQQLTKEKQTRDAIEAINKREAEDLKKKENEKEKIKEAEDRFNKGIQSSMAKSAEETANLTKLTNIRDEIERLAIQGRSPGANRIEIQKQIADLLMGLKDQGKEGNRIYGEYEKQFGYTGQVYSQNNPLNMAGNLLSSINTSITSKGLSDDKFKSAVDRFDIAVTKFAGKTVMGNYGKITTGIVGGPLAGLTGGLLGTSPSEASANALKLIQEQGLKAGDTFTYQDQKFKVNANGKTITKLAMGGHVRNYDMGSIGGVRGPGTGTSDSIPAMLSNGEYVLRASAVRAVGVPMLDEINKMAMGGLAAKYDVGKKIPVPAQNGRYNRGGTVQNYNVGGLVMNFENGGQVDGRMLFEQFKSAMALEQLKSGGGGRLR